DKLIKDNEDKLPEEVKTEVQADVDALKAALEKQDNDDEVKTAFEKLQASQTKLGEAIYSQAQSEGAAAADAEAPNAEEDIVDAEVIDEDEKK
ncbi:MAG: molecular chaperone DnaK, partial [Paeniglutamicibacter sp.]